jgi:hypothetical protein
MRCRFEIYHSDPYGLVGSGALRVAALVATAENDCLNRAAQLVDPNERCEAMTETASVASSRATGTRWLYPILAVTGIAVGIAVVAAVVYLLFDAQSGCCHSMTKADAPAAHSKDCCDGMKDMKMPMETMPNAPMPAPSH